MTGWLGEHYKKSSHDCLTLGKTMRASKGFMGGHVESHFGGDLVRPEGGGFFRHANIPAASETHKHNT